MIHLARNLTVARLILLCLLCSLILTLVMSMWPIVAPKHNPYDAIENNDWIEPHHKLAIIVPFRDRFQELIQFVPHLHKFLMKQRVNHKIYVINQSDSLRFNRASLINIGFLIARSECDYIAMHDVDLLPLNPELQYLYPSEGPLHLAAPDLHPKYHYKTFVGGILLINREQFEKLNGLSNNYWGWGLEGNETSSTLLFFTLNDL